MRFIPKEAMYRGHEDYALLHGVRALGELPPFDAENRGWFVEHNIAQSVENFMRDFNEPRNDAMS